METLRGQDACGTEQLIGLESLLDTPIAQKDSETIQHCKMRKQIIRCMAYLIH